MATFLSTTNITTLKNALSDHFDTFTHDRTRLLVVHKEPVQTFNLSSAPVMYGFEPSATEEVTYTPVTGIFPAMITYDLNQKRNELDDVKNTVEQGTVRIKVEPEAKVFIDDGRKNEKFEFDGNTYNVISSEGVQNYLGLVYYIFKLKATN